MKKHPLRKSLVTLLAAFCVLFHCANAEDVKLTLQTMEDFHSAEQAAAQKPVLLQDEGYRSKLTKLQKTFQDAGNLRAVLAAKRAIEDLDAGLPITPSEEAEVATLQKTYSTNRQKAEADSVKARAKVDQDYLISLKKLVADLTKKGEIEQAMEAQAKVDQLGTLPGKEPATVKPAPEQAQSEWKNKALAEFPDLSDPNSPLSKRVQSLKELKRNHPSYFSNPQWPYLLTQEASKALEPETLNARFCGLYYNTGKILCFPFYVDGSGKVSGSQFNLQAGDGPVISGKRDGNKLISKWFALNTRKPHDFTFTLLPDGNLVMEGDHGFDEKFHHKETLTRITDRVEYERVLKRIADSTKNDDIQAIVSKLKAPGKVQ